MVCGGWKKLAGRSIGQCGPLVLQSYVKCRRGPWAQTGRTRLFLGPRGERATSASEGGPCAPGPFCSIARGARKWFVADCAVVMMMPKILHPNCQGQVDYSCILCAAGGKFGGGATGRRTRHATLRDPSPQSARSRMFVPCGHTSAAGDSIQVNKNDTKSGWMFEAYSRPQVRSWVRNHFGVARDDELNG